MCIKLPIAFLTEHIFSRIILSDDYIFWYSSLTYPNLSLEDLLNNHKHELYHIYTGNPPCCLCPTGYVFPVKSPVLNQQQWTTLLWYDDMEVLHRFCLKVYLVVTDEGCGFAAIYILTYIDSILLYCSKNDKSRVDSNGATLPCHRTTRRTDYCCCKAIPGVSTRVMDVTLAKIILINFCKDIFWYSSLTFPNFIIKFLSHISLFTAYLGNL
jgi:hypothetical protein